MVTHLGHDGWVVVADERVHFGDDEEERGVSYSSGTGGADALLRAGWTLDDADPVAALTAERYAAQDTAAQAIADFDRVVRERDEARTEASHLRSRCAAYEAALGEDHADTVRDRDEAREALANAVEILNCVADQVTPFAYDEIRSVLDSEPGDLRSRVAMLEAARGADQRMLCRILGVESEASISVLLERVEVLLGRRGKP
jgi:hypothetical protein